MGTQRHELKQKEFEKTAINRLNLIKRKMEVDEQILKGIVSFYNASKFVDRAEFKKYVDHILMENKFIKALEWIPKVLSRERLTYEAELFKHFSEDGRFKEKNLQGKLVIASKRDVYYPVFYVEPLLGNEEAVGFDLRSHPKRSKSLDEARDSGKIIATEKINLVQEMNNSPGILIFAPVYNHHIVPKTVIERRKKIKGFVLSVLKLEDMFSKYLLSKIPSHLKVAIFDGNISDERLLYGKKIESSHFFLENTLELFGKVWIFQWYGEKSFHLEHNPKHHFYTSAFIFIFFIFIVLYLETNKEKSKAILDERLKSEFLATMSHEIRTPMNGIIGMIDLLSSTKMSQEQKEMVSILKSCGTGLTSILNDVLDLSKLEKGKVELEELPFDLTICVKEVISLMSYSAIDKKIELRYVIDPKVPQYLVGDITRLKQILFNLISNSIKFTNSGGVSLFIKNEDLKNDKVCISFAVKDTGIGLSEEAQRKLFKAFSQADSSITRRYGGTGLGLAIVQKISNLMNGKIFLESEPEQGTTITLVIPFTQTTKDDFRGKERGDVDKIVGDSLKINTANRVLIVEDNKVN